MSKQHSRITLGTFWLSTLKPLLPQLMIIQLLAFGWTLDFTVWPHMTRWLINSIVTHEQERADAWRVLASPLQGIIMTWLTLEIMGRLQGFRTAKIFPACESLLRMHMVEKTMQHGYQFFANNFAGSLVNRINDMSAHTMEILRLVMTLFIPSLMAFIIAVSGFAILHPSFALILGGWIILHLSICLISAQRSDLLAFQHSEQRSTLTGVLVDSFTNSLTVKLFARRNQELNYIHSFQEKEVELHQRSLIYIEKVKIILGAATFLIPGMTMILYMIYSWQHARINVGDVVLIFNTTFNIMMMAWLTGLELPNFFKHIGFCRQALSILKAEQDVEDVPNAVPLVVTEGEIKFDRVTFHYRHNANLFENKSITIPAGQKVGLVGFSGSGKSTFVHLILRYFDINSGTIFIDGQDISQVTQESLRAQIAMIPQEPLLFHRTLLENIRYSRLEATDEEVYNAAKQAFCHDFILKLPEQYQTLVGERGVKLSGGQRQRIAIARALLKDAKILILDEATSALDSMTERFIQHSLEVLMEKRTTLVIAHRLSTLVDMDRILVFDCGRIVEDGTHEELLQKGGHYARLWHMQVDGFLPVAQ